MRLQVFIVNECVYDLLLSALIRKLSDIIRLLLIIRVVFDFDANSCWWNMKQTKSNAFEIRHKSSWGLFIWEILIMGKGKINFIEIKINLSGQVHMIIG